MESKISKKELEKRCQQLQQEREEMWERLGMNWKEGSCLPKGKERAAFAFIDKLIKWKAKEKEQRLLKVLS